MGVVAPNLRLRLLMVASVALVGLIYAGILAVLLAVGVAWWLSLGAVAGLILLHVGATNSIYRAVLAIGKPPREGRTVAWLRRMGRRVAPWLVVPLTPLAGWLALSRDPESLLPVVLSSVVIGIAELPVVALLLYLGVGRSQPDVVRRARPDSINPESRAGEASRLLDKLCERNGIARPRFFVASSNVPNAWAMGWSPRRGVICITFGLLGVNELTSEELQSVLAHELSHLANRDSAIMQVAAVPAVACDFLFESLLTDPDPGAAGLLSWALAAALYPFVMLMTLITIPLSRQREYSADRGGAILTGHPKASASALRKISGGIERCDLHDLETLRPASSLMFVRPVNRAVKRLADRAFSTHPTVERRIRALEALEAQMSGAPALELDRAAKNR